MSAPTLSHVSPEFIEVFGRALSDTRSVFLAPDGQPFVIAATGTFALEFAAANLVEPGDRVLEVNTGYFSDRMAVTLERHGAAVTHVRADVGGAPSLRAIEAELKTGTYKACSLTHVDTSTGVLADVEGIAALATRYGALSIVDSVCAIAGEELRQTDWGVDVCVTASQKAIGVPPGLALAMVGPRAMAAFQARKSPVRSYYADIAEWLPIMRAYEERRPSYFGTPAVNLVCALAESLKQILAEGMEARVGRHRTIARAFRSAWVAMGLRMVPLTEDVTANTMSAVYYPDGVDVSVLAKVKSEGVILATGLHPAIRARYFRVGHMGTTRVGEALATIGAIEKSLLAAGHGSKPGAGVSAALASLAG
jgi:alanine-glyoxylate transaminase/serine-glyoxylate transaminase/serine-pyruvate transaminase